LFPEVAAFVIFITFLLAGVFLGFLATGYPFSSKISFFIFGVLGFLGFEVLRFLTYFSEFESLSI
jgi:hypothetical protein